MITKCYISVNFSKRHILESEMQMIKQVLLKHNILPCIFVDEYNFNKDQEKEMMQLALEEINKCQLLIAETTEKGIGIGIEAGYAKGKNLPVIYMRNEKSEHSTTLSGISDEHIIYKDCTDLENKLEKALLKFVK